MGHNKARLLVTIDEAARMLSISPKTIRNQLTRNAVRQFPVQPVRLGGRVLFRVTDLEALVENLPPR
jgi:predicted DNA-binding transcriptional regulator AlpA